MNENSEAHRDSAPYSTEDVYEGRAREGGSWGLLWSYLRGFRVLMGSMLVLELFGHAATLAEPKVTEHVLDALAVHHSAFKPLMFLGVLAVAGLFLDAIAELSMLRGSERLVRNARRTLVRRVMRSTVGAVERRPMGDFLSRMDSDTTMLEQTVDGALIQAASAPAMLIGMVALMASLNVMITIVVVSVLLFTTWVQRFALYRIGDAIELAQERVANMTSAMQRALVAFRTVKASGTDRAEEANVIAEADRAYAAGIIAAKAEVTLEIIATTAMDTLFLVVLVLGSLQVEHHHMTVGALVAYMLYLMSLDEPVDDLYQASSEIVEGMAAVRRLEDMRHLPLEEDMIPLDKAFTTTPDTTTTGWCHTQPPHPENHHLDITFENVHYSYNNRHVLRGVTFHAPRGLSVLVGPSGAGKTTLLSLIERFVETDHGTIRLGTTDIRDINRRDLRKHLAYVQQEAPLLGATIREAALYGVPETEHPYLEGALRDVNLTDWITTLPQGLDTPVGERGIGISGGQRQRLAVARALLRGSDILLLDEATSQLDTVGEQTLLHTITNQAHHRTIIAVTHRLSVATTADQVLLIDQGKVRAAGKHTHLLHTDQMYRELVAAAGVPIGTHPT